jgi:acyl-CoA reductase-like NAD-dependent aldehyde dehydrogenase
MTTVGIGHQQLLIGDEWRDASSGARFEKRNPFNGEPAGTIAAATRKDARAAADAA